MRNDYMGWIYMVYGDIWGGYIYHLGRKGVVQYLVMRWALVGFGLLKNEKCRQEPIFQTISG